MIGIVYSKQDEAGKNIANALLNKKCSHQLIKIQEDIIHPKAVDSLGMDLLVFASRHKAVSGKPSLTVHSTGNFGSADFGGKAHTMQNTVANTKHNIYLELLECTLDYEITLEVTHHGPTNFSTPLFFVEIGSTEKQWMDLEASEFVAECILNGLKSNKKHKHAIGFGGGHYAPKFSEMDLAFSHICPKYACDSLSEDLVKQMIEKTVDKVDLAVLDEKGLKGRQKTIIKEMLNE